MKQDTWQPLNENWNRPADTDGIFLGQYGLIVSLSVQNGFKSALLLSCTCLPHPLPHARHLNTLPQTKISVKRKFFKKR